MRQIREAEEIAGQVLVLREPLFVNIQHRLQLGPVLLHNTQVGLLLPHVLEKKQLRQDFGHDRAEVLRLHLQPLLGHGAVQAALSI